MIDSLSPIILSQTCEANHNKCYRDRRSEAYDNSQIDVTGGALMGMSMQTKQEYLEEIKCRYLNGNRMVKRQLLDQAAELTGMHRKSLIRYFNNEINRIVINRIKHKRGRRSKYDYPAFKNTLKDIWLETEKMGSWNLKQALPEWLPSYERLKGVIEEPVKEDLLRISPATIDRLIHPYRAKYGRGKSGTKPGTLLKTEIPIRGGEWNIDKPGYLEADTVAHCGASLAGEFVWTFTLTDIHTQWTEIRPVWHKGAKATLEQLKDVEKTLPFEMLGFDCDNGAEFINHYFVEYFREKNRLNNLFQFTRSRPYKKDDNAHVEQKNWTYARQLLGYQRIDSHELMPALATLLKAWSMLKNHFYPCKKLIKKIRVGSSYRKIYDLPRTPYQRILDSSHIHDDIKLKLRQSHDSLDPCSLRREIRRNLNALIKNSSVTSNYEASIPARRLLR